MRSEYISTKFYIPVAPDRYVVRQRLVEKLKHQTGIRLSLLIAPAGFGKTTAVIHSINDLKARQDDRNVKIAWLSLDEHDNSLVEFVSYFIGALQQVEKDFAYDLQIGILSGQHPPISYIAKELINQLASLATPLHFVLDDFHVIDDLKIAELMNLVVEYLPPQVHLMITSRKPIALDLPRWRGRGWLNEVEAKHLRFTLPETEAFLSNTMKLAEGIEIAPVLQERTGGWVVGLQLAAFSIREGEDYHDFLAGFGGGTKFISDYLMAEVFAKQPPHIQDFLLKTSITDKFTTTLCAVIVNIDVGLAHTILGELEKSDLFFITLDDEGMWFQYHKLFLEFLEKQRQIKLDADTISNLHHNAAQWYGAQHYTVKAIDHSLLAKNYDEAVRWMEAIEFEQVWEQSVGSKFSTWIPQFPGDKLKEYPQLVKAACGALLIRSEWQLLNELLQILEDCEEAENEYKFFMGTRLRPTDQEGALELFNQVVSATSQENIYHHFALSSTALVLMEMGELKQATKMMSDFNNQYVNIGIPHPIIWVQLISILSYLHYLQGQLGEAEAVLAQAFDHLTKIQYTTPMIGLLHNNKGQICLARNELDESEKHFSESLRWGNLSGISDILHFAFLGISDIMLARYDQDALVKLEDGYQVLRANGGSLGAHEKVLDAHKAYMNLNLDNEADAIRWADTCGLTTDDHPNYQNHSLYQVYVAVRLRQFYKANDIAALLNLLPLIELLQLQAQLTNHIHHYLNCLIAKSIIYGLDDRKSLSLAALDEALELLERTDLLRVFLLWKQPLSNLMMNLMPAKKHSETIRRVLLALSNQPGMQPALPTSADENQLSLTNRELEILTLIALGLTNKKIAMQLVISDNTLRTHIRNLYRKLGVNNRTQAMKAGQDHGLI